MSSLSFQLADLLPLFIIFPDQTFMPHFIEWLANIKEHDFNFKVINKAVITFLITV